MTIRFKTGWIFNDYFWYSVIFIDQLVVNLLLTVSAGTFRIPQYLIKLCKNFVRRSMPF